MHHAQFALIIPLLAKVKKVQWLGDFPHFPNVAKTSREGNLLDRIV